MSLGRVLRIPSRCAVPLLGCALAFCALASAQPTTIATVSFGLDFPGSQPDRYAISIPLSGNATYYSDGKLTPNSASDEFRVDFTISESTRTRVFDLAKRLRYFEGEIDSRKKGIAFTGTKSLMYKDAEKDMKATYNYSSIPAVQELTEIFQSLSTTLEFGRRLDYYHRYQKLALDDELKRLEQMAKQNSVQELSAIAPVLEQIANDASVINPVRARAQRLLEQAGAASH
jgi:hypothetical protein